MSKSNISKGTTDFIKYVEDLGSIGDRNISAIVDLFDDVDESVIEAAKSLKDGKISIEEFKSSALNATSSNAKFAASLKSIAANVGIMLAVNLAVKGISYVILYYLIKDTFRCLFTLPCVSTI